MSKKIHVVFQVMNFIKKSELSAYDRATLINLSEHLGLKGIFPSIKTIAKEMRVSRNTIKRSIKSLCDKNLIKIIPRIGYVNHYELTVPGVIINQKLSTDLALTEPTPWLSQSRHI